MLTSALTADEIALPDQIRSLTELDQGLVFITGVDKSLRSATMHCLAQVAAGDTDKRILSIEENQEYELGVREGQQILVSSGEDAFGNTVRRVLRMRPDVIFSHDVRGQKDLEAVTWAGSCAHFIFAGLGTDSVASTITTLADMTQLQPYGWGAATWRYPPALQAIVSQRSIPSTLGQKVGVNEVCIVTDELREMLCSGELDQEELKGAIGRAPGSTYQESLDSLISSGIVTPEVADLWFKYDRDQKSKDGQPTASLAST